MNDFAKGALAGAGLVILVVVLVRHEMLLTDRQASPAGSAAQSPTVSVTAIGPDGSADGRSGRSWQRRAPWASGAWATPRLRRPPAAFLAFVRARVVRS